MASDLPFLVIAELASFLESPDDLFAFMLVNKRHSAVLMDKVADQAAHHIWRAALERHYGKDCSAHAVDGGRPLSDVEKNAQGGFAVPSGTARQVLVILHYKLFKFRRAAVAGAKAPFPMRLRDRLELVASEMRASESDEKRQSRAAVLGRELATALLLLGCDVLLQRYLTEALHFFGDDGTKALVCDYSIGQTQLSASNSMYFAAAYGDVHCLKMIIDVVGRETALRVAKRKVGWCRTALQGAVCSTSSTDSLDAIKVLLDLHDDWWFLDSSENYDEDGSNLFHLCVQAQNVETVRLLADVDWAKKKLAGLEELVTQAHNDVEQSIHDILARWAGEHLEHGATPLMRAAHDLPMATELARIANAACESTINSVSSHYYPSDPPGDANCACFAAHQLVTNPTVQRLAVVDMMVKAGAVPTMPRADQHTCYSLLAGLAQKEGVDVEFKQQLIATMKEWRELSYMRPVDIEYMDGLLKDIGDEGVKK